MDWQQSQICESKNGWRCLWKLIVNCFVLPVTAAIAKESGELRGKLQAQGKPRTQADMLIAATAKIHQLTLVTRNVKDFQDCDIVIFDPFV